MSRSRLVRASTEAHELPETDTFFPDLVIGDRLEDVLDALDNGQIEAPFATWSTVSSSALVVVDNGTLAVAARLIPVDTGWSAHTFAARLSQFSDSRELTTDSPIDVGPLLNEAANLAKALSRVRKTIEQHLNAWRASTRGSRSRRSDLAYAALAARYAELVANGEHKPTQIIADELGLSPTTVSQRVREARREPLSLLTETKHGAAGGNLTSKARNILRQASEQG